jgi:type VI secretion system secreted protein VgrG
MNDVFTISTSGLPEGARVVGFRGHEAISRPYAFEIYVTVASEESHELDLGDAVSSKATLTLDRQDGRPPFAFHGILAEVSLIHEMGGRALVRALLVPRLWLLGQTFHSRVFTAMSIPDIIKETLEDGGLSSDEYVFKLVDQYKSEEHVCQYQESHLDFISRWMEREGLYYYFEQEDGQEKLVITDNRAAQHALEPRAIRFHALTGNDVSAKECLQTFLCRHKSLPGTVKFKDHDYSKPRLKVAGSAPITSNGIGDISVHGARFFTPEAGKRLATLRAEEMLAREVLFTGSGTSFFLRAGYTFALEDHPRQSFDAKYLAIEVEHQGNQGASTPELRKLTGLDTDEVYRVDVTAIPATVQFRAELRTAWPRIYGTEHGTIDGEAESEYAQIDEHGRYVVRFAFDESILGNGKASTRVRMMQPHGGGVEGWHFPLRKGTEVLFTFLGGDPDRPVIAGVVPNALTPSPVTAGNHTKNVIQTGGRNRLELEDKAGLQRITLSTPHSNTYLRMGSPNGMNGAANNGHELIVHTDNNAFLDTGADWDVNVGGKLSETVKGTTTEVYIGKQDTTVYGGRVELHSTQDTTVRGIFKGTYGAYESKIENSREEFVGGAVTLNANGSITIHSDVAIKLSAPEFHGITPSSFKVTSHSEEIYGFKNSAGAEKFDGCVLATSVNGEKYDATAVSRSVVGTSTSSTGLKIDKAMQSLSMAGIKVDHATTRATSGGAAMTKSEFESNTGAFISFARGLIKMG